MGRITGDRRAFVGVFVFGLLVLSLTSCTKSPEEKSRIWVNSAKGAIDRKDYGRALVDLNNALQATPKDADAHYHMGLVLLAHGEPGRAAQSFRSAIQFQPSHTRARLKLVELLLATDEPKALPIAEEQAKIALEQAPNDPDIRHWRGVIRWRQGKVNEAVDELKQALRLAPGHLRSSASLAQIQRAELKDPAAAERTMRQAVDQSSGSAESHVAFGRFYVTSGQPQAAEAEFRRALTRDPNHTSALEDLAKLLLARGERVEAEQVLRRLSASSDKSFRTLHATYLFESGQREAAIAELKQILGKDSSDGESRKLLIRFYLLAGRKDEGQQELRDALSRNPQDPDLLEELGRTHLLEGRFEQARKTAAEVLRARPDSGSAHYLDAQALRGMGQLAEARQALEDALRLNPRLVQARVELSQLLRNAGRLPAAFQVIEGAPADQKQTPAVLLERNWVLIAQGRYAEADSDLKKVIETSRTPAALIQGGLLALQQNRLEPGRGLLEEALRMDPENVDALNAIASSLASEGKQSLALERVSTQAARVPKSAPIHFVHGSWLEKAGDVPGARKAYEASIASNPAYGPAAVALARIDILQGRWDDARKRSQQVLERENRNQDALLALGMAEEASGRHRAAIEVYRTLLRVNPDHIVAKNNLAMRLAEDPSMAGEALTLAHELDRAAPNNPDIKDTVGWVYHKNKMHDAAIRYLEGAANKSNSAAIKYHLAIAYFGANKRSQGQKALAAALALDPNLPEAALARRAAESAQ